MSLSGVVLQAKRAQSGRGLMGGVAGEMMKQAVTTVGAVTHQTRALVRDKLGGGGWLRTQECLLLLQKTRVQLPAHNHPFSGYLHWPLLAPTFPCMHSACKLMQAT